MSTCLDLSHKYIVTSLCSYKLLLSGCWNSVIVLVKAEMPKMLLPEQSKYQITKETLQLHSCFFSQPLPSNSLSLSFFFLSRFTIHCANYLIFSFTSLRSTDFTNYIPQELEQVFGTSEFGIPLVLQGTVLFPLSFYSSSRVQ